MCIFITLIAKACDKEIVSDVLMQVGRRAELVDNPSLRKVIGSDEIQLLTTNGHCDCGTVLGDGPVDETQDKFATKISKLRRKKWSQAKIDKYIQNRKKAENKKAASRIEQAPDSAEIWEFIIKEVRDKGASPIGLFYRMYRGFVEDEVFEPSIRRTKNLPGNAQEFRSMKENEVSFFT